MKRYPNRSHPGKAGRKQIWTDPQAYGWWRSITNSRKIPTTWKRYQDFEKFVLRKYRSMLGCGYPARLYIDLPMGPENFKVLKKKQREPQKIYLLYGHRGTPSGLAKKLGVSPSRICQMVKAGQGDTLRKRLLR